jgi:hypothetical protein
VVVIAAAPFDGVEGRALTTGYHGELRARYVAIEPYNSNQYATHWFEKRLPASEA